MVTTIAALAALWFTNQSLKATSDQFGLARQTAVTERFAKAVEQLGNSNSLDVRLGGIYLLERLATDSPDDRSSIFAVLSAFVRTHAPNGPGCGALDHDHAVAPAADVQAVMAVIGRRHTGGAEVIDLSDTCLANIDLQRANLRFALLDKANLAYAHLNNAYLAGASLEHATLDAVTAADVDLTDSQLPNASLRGATLEGAVLKGSQLNGADLRYASLMAAQLDRAMLANADLRGALFDFPKGSAGYMAFDFDDKVPGSRLAVGTVLKGAYLGLAQFDDRTVWPEGFVPTLSDRPVR